MLSLVWATPDGLQLYLRDDWVLRRLISQVSELSQVGMTDRWLMESPAKRYIYGLMFGDLVGKKKEISVGEIGPGPGYSSLWVTEGRESVLIDSHPDFSLENGIHGDWSANWRHLNGCGIILANDVFPNVDQRLLHLIQLFLDSSARELRISLTFFKDIREYLVKRIDAEELLTFKAWQPFELKSVLMEAFPEERATIEQTFLSLPNSIFPNNRLVMILKFSR